MINTHYFLGIRASKVVQITDALLKGQPEHIKISEDSDVK